MATDEAAPFQTGPADCAFDAGEVLDGAWPMLHYDAAGTHAAPETNGPTSFPLNERWTVSALESRVALPVADTDYVYFLAMDEGDGEAARTTLLCHDPLRNGEIQWRYQADAMPVGPPISAADVVYVPFGDAADVRIVALDRENGEPLNTYPLPGRFQGALSSVGASLVIPTESRYQVVDARTGRSCWSFSPNAVDATDSAGQHIRATAVGDGIAYIGTGFPDGAPTTQVGHLYAVDPSRAGTRWTVTLDSPVNRLAVDDGVLVATTGSGLVGFDAASGSRLWDTAVEAHVRPATLAMADRMAVYGTRRTLHGLDTATGAERWSLPFGVRGDVIFVGDVLYAVGRSDPTSQRILLGAVDVESGQPRWQQEIYDPIVDVMAANGYLYAITTDGRLFAFSSV
ncbi:hypothetical protein JCM17092_08710 [Haloplanus litoreus]